MSDSYCNSEPVYFAAVEEDCAGGLVIEVFDDLDKVDTDVVLLRGCQQSCMPNPVEGLLEVRVDLVEVLLVLEMFFTKDFQVEDLLCGASPCSVALLPALKPACSSAMIFSACGFNLFCMIFSMTLLEWLMR